MTNEDEKAPKIFVLDTNVILHDCRSIWNFQENDVALPITVLEELDQFKRGNEDINFQAREALRKLDDITGDLLSAEGAPLGEGLGNIRVVFGREFADVVKQAFVHDSPDHRILSTTLTLQRSEVNRSIVLVTKDTNLRMKAKSLGIRAQDYTSDMLENVNTLYTGKRIIDAAPFEAIDALYESDEPVEPQRLGFIENPVANENFILRNGSKSVLSTFDASTPGYVRVEKATAFGITPRNAEQAFAIKALVNDDISLVSLAGKAGTGKTIVALAAALECRSRYRQILLARPVVPLSNRDIGYLPGDIDAKIGPYMQPLYDNLSVIKHQVGEKNHGNTKIQEMLEGEKLVITPLAYIRGRSLQRVFFIVDEAQNLTPHEVKTIITRAGEGTKIVFTGDIHQIDQPYLNARSNGLSYLISRMVRQPIFAHITLEKGERSALAELASNLL